MLSSREACPKVINLGDFNTRTQACLYELQLAVAESSLPASVCTFPALCCSSHWIWREGLQEE